MQWAAQRLHIHDPMEVHPTLALILGNDPAALKWLRGAMLAASTEVVGVAALREASEAIGRLQPDIVVAVADRADSALVDQLRDVRQSFPLPIAVFFDQLDRDGVGELTRGLVNACVVGRPEPERVDSVLMIATERFEHERSLHKALEDARSTLADRKWVDRAKGVLMQRHSLDEDQAFRALRRLAMNEGMRLGEAARRLISEARGNG